MAIAEVAACSTLSVVEVARALAAYDDEVQKRIGSPSDVLAQELRDTRRALILAAGALRSAPQSCRYHGQDFNASGMWCGEPRCESCQQPFRVVNALATLDAQRPARDVEGDGVGQTDG